MKKKKINTWSGIVKIESEPEAAGSKGTSFYVRTIHGGPEVKYMIVTNKYVVKKILMFGTKGKISVGRRSGVKGDIKIIAGEGSQEEIKEYPIRTLIGTLIEINGGELIEEIMNRYVLINEASQINILKYGQHTEESNQ